MRISGGAARGHTIEVPDAGDLRPSQEIVREAIFNILHEVKGKLVLDLYAGTGVLGLEALSRGARHCDFVEKEKHVATSIRHNANHSLFQDKYDLFEEDAHTFVNREIFQRYDIIFLDPPYVEMPRDVLFLLPRFLAPGGVLIYLHGKNMVLDTQADREMLGEKLKVVDNRRYGATQVTFLMLRQADHTLVSQTVNEE
ncbi:hypothetical protein CO180_02240 [candidate division WWE3 bacterium CG_4_9_14_3_um_filter_41_6]|uniref:16S rRNA (Guanine(966)-N(2))-methyltransferase RsmD n=1 Tax=candidate division WWE3 bacterium CG_4_10_14_0_2_um_filter_41_14 TaxID=1975072 RepID=A0A2M7TLY0_UNCKA|nr:MAG: hypothetical protein COY32_00320 [candidate division WWE3 bacterium CG_4_10_14_0_2_um_filter_41_14]PJA38851.1 MAG: hypothetical protein CO180_02240 [candidate division WWE3 bacterium CG_4_9_14_3_um_filter_41_6]